MRGSPQCCVIPVAMSAVGVPPSPPFPPSPHRSSSLPTQYRSQPGQFASLLRFWRHRYQWRHPASASISLPILCVSDRPVTVGPMPTSRPRRCTDPLPRPPAPGPRCFWVVHPRTVVLFIITVSGFRFPFSGRPKHRSGRWTTIRCCRYLIFEACVAVLPVPPAPVCPPSCQRARTLARPVFPRTSNYISPICDFGHWPPVVCAMLLHTYHGPHSFSRCHCREGIC